MKFVTVGNAFVAVKAFVALRTVVVKDGGSVRYTHISCHTDTIDTNKISGGARPVWGAPAEQQPRCHTMTRPLHMEKGVALVGGTRGCN